MIKRPKGASTAMYSKHLSVLKVFVNFVCQLNHRIQCHFLNLFLPF